MIGVIGGTGKIGRALVGELRQKGADFRCIVRDPEAAAETLGAGVTLVRGDLADPDSLDSAFEGIERLFVVSGLGPKLADLETNAIEAAKRAGVSYVVKSSAVEAMIGPDSPTEIGRQHAPVEQALDESGLAWTILRPTLFMQNTLNQRARVANESKFAMPVSTDVRVSMIDIRDIGACAAEVLTAGGHEGQIYTLTGAAVTFAEIVDAFTRSLGRDVEFVTVPETTSRANMAKLNMPDWLIAHFVGVGELLRGGRLAEVSDDVRAIIGREPHDFASFVAANAAAFGG